METNLIVTNVGCKNLILKKLSCSVLCSVSMQILILFFVIIFINFDIFNPLAWFSSTLNIFASLSTWFLLSLFMSVTFMQTIVCAKHYVLKEVYCSTRFKKLLSVFSIRNFVILTLHVVTGGLMVWLYLSLSSKKYSKIYSSCTNNKYCLVEETVYMIMNGMWSGIYYFICVYPSHKHIVFPVINQSKFLQFKANAVKLVKNSKSTAIWCTVYFFIFYYFCGNIISTSLSDCLGVYLKEESHDLRIYLYSYLFAVLYFFNMNLMCFLFDLFLTEPVEFPLMPFDNNTITLQEAMKLSNMPIAQKLACLDFYLFSHHSPERRQILFSLSQPGGHPHNWNNLIQSILLLFKEYMEVMNKSMCNMTAGKSQKPTGQSEYLNETNLHHKCSNIRNMSMMLQPVNIVDVSYNKFSPRAIATKEYYVLKINEKFDKLANFFKRRLGYNYLFDELPEVNVQKCLANGQILIWTCEGISAIVTASIKEDRFGIVLKDLPILLTTLVQVKQNIEQLNKVPGLMRKGSEFSDFYFKMKLGITSAVRRCLVNICLHFGDHLTDLALSKETLLQLNSYIIPKNL